MKKYIIALRVHVYVEAISWKEAQQIAFKDAQNLLRAPETVVTAAEFVREG